MANNKIRNSNDARPFLWHILKHSFTSLTLTFHTDAPMHPRTWVNKHLKLHASLPSQVIFEEKRGIKNRTKQYQHFCTGFSFVSNRIILEYQGNKEKCCIYE